MDEGVEGDAVGSDLAVVRAAVEIAALCGAANAADAADAERVTGLSIVERGC